MTAGALAPSGATATYQWQSASTAGGTYSNISGATSSTYAITSAVLGKYIKVVATGSGSYTGAVTSAASAVVTSGTYTLNLIAGSGGTVSQSGTSPYASGSTPTIIATPNSGYQFNGWTGTNCNIPNSATHAVPAMTANMTCTANFTANPATTYHLTLYIGTGGATPGTYDYDLDQGSTVSIAAMPDTGYAFSEWTGSTGCSGAYIHDITMNGDKTCTASFYSTGGTNYTVTINSSTGGTYTGDGTYSAGSQVYLRATPDTPYYIFSSWGGDSECSGAQNHYFYNISRNVSCTLTFSVVDWIPGINNMTGKYVYASDNGTNMYKDTNTASYWPQVAINVDSGHMTYTTLLSPQAYPAVDFSAYYAQSVCKTFGGRLPYLTELESVYNDRFYYANFNIGLSYMSAAENPSNTAQNLNVNFNGGAITNSNKTTTHPFRCVKD